MSREPIDKVLETDKIAAETRKKLTFTKSVIEFARKAGLEVGSSYKYYIELGGEAVSYTVQAARPTELELKTWWFPIVGRVPYLGYFDRKDRDKEAEALEKQGFEIYKGSVAAYSSLGWFADPVYSSMLRRSDVDLAHLYFHELTHRTLWLNGGVEFNENLAEFVADVLTKEFFTSLNRIGELEDLKREQKDYRLFKVWLDELRRTLKASLEASREKPHKERVAEKTKVIDMAVAKKPAFNHVDFVGSGTWNNARILAAGLYSPNTSAFETSAVCFTRPGEPSWVGNFLKSLKKNAEATGDGFSALTTLCKGS
jgi:predicted aminopeptidase